MTLNHFDQRPVPATDSTPDSAPPSPPGIASICPVKGLGRAYVTEPGIRLEPLDRAAFGAWALANRPGDARRRLEAVAERIDRWLNASTGDAEDRAARLRELLDDPKAVKESVLLSEGLLDDLAATCAVACRCSASPPCAPHLRLLPSRDSPARAGGRGETTRERRPPLEQTFYQE